MEILTKTAFILFVNLICVTSAPTEPPLSSAGTTVPSSLQNLDAANLETLNRETRKALLTIVGNELETARAMMKSIQPEVNICQEKVDQKFSDCVQCVDMKCQNRYKECNGSIQIIAPNTGGVSVSSSVNNMGRPVTTICTVIWGQSEACTTVMNPDGVFATSINSMGNNLHVNLHSVANDLGENVGIFVNQMQGVVGDINSTQMSNEELERLLNDLNTGLSGMQFELQHMFDGFHQDMQQSMAGVDQAVSQIGPNVNQMVSQIGPNVNRVVSQIGPNVNQMISQVGPNMRVMQHIGPNVRRRVSQATSGLSQLGPNINQHVNSNVNGMLYNLHQGLGQWGNNFGQSLNRMLSGMFGRKKRQARIIADPSHDIKCDVMLKNSTVCAEYRTKCDSCPHNENITEGDVIRHVCGDAIVEKVMQIDQKLAELSEMEAKVVSTKRIIEQIELDKTSWNQDNFAFNKVFINTDIRGHPMRFISKSGLKMMDHPTTGKSIAKQIWHYWNDPTMQKPK